MAIPQAWRITPVLAFGITSLGVMLTIYLLLLLELFGEGTKTDFALIESTKLPPLPPFPPFPLPFSSLSPPFLLPYSSLSPPLLLPFTYPSLS